MEASSFCPLDLSLERISTALEPAPHAGALDRAAPGHSHFPRSFRSTNASLPASFLSPSLFSPPCPPRMFRSAGRQAGPGAEGNRGRALQPPAQADQPCLLPGPGPSQQSGRRDVCAAEGRRQVWPPALRAGDGREQVGLLTGRCLPGLGRPRCPFLLSVRPVGCAAAVCDLCGPSMQRCPLLRAGRGAKGKTRHPCGISTKSREGVMTGKTRTEPWP